jgi:pilus assembly protein Flp/PilA
LISSWRRQDGAPELNRAGSRANPNSACCNRRQSGATAIEYGLIAAGISLAIIAVVNGLGTNLNTKFTDINTSLK